MPLIIAGDYSVDMSKPNTRFTQYMKDVLDERRACQDLVPTTRNGGVIDHFFIRGIHDFQQLNYTSYFSVHRPLVTVITDEFDNNSCSAGGAD